jgi:hypothetical protein
MAEVVVENGYWLQDDEDGLSNDSLRCNEQEFRVKGEETQGDMDLDGQLTRELHAGPAVSISNDIDVNEFNRRRGIR